MNKFYLENRDNVALLSLLFKMLDIDPKKRITASEALGDLYFKNLHNHKLDEGFNSVPKQNIIKCEPSIDQCEQTRIFLIFLGDFKKECNMSVGTFAIVTNILHFVIAKLNPLQKDVMKWCAAIAYLACGANEPRPNLALFDYAAKYDIDHTIIFEKSLQIFKAMDYNLY